ncbi:programmed cell death protein 2 isoform X2 [Linepithema humile]|uniref:programmed cell death protein 2 isoform X2 n=1 Tax=Linepithema humile TaxID=83485 RepID=UPI000623A693|nr:PREDICTED: programmed cell death protein 2 [Linepithema humile]XP_012231791.1 PREDICTED: programmed cell death protein 2 [Linepithema humile]XP_012231798.1 PREDICTED: programmed cell death protein 2 [Linepithema humile]XP_012231809.1 PREDICTED: programmed cell death protein 2 [Linepithema humile]
MTVELGFIKKSEPWQLESRFFPSKAGGKPAWLDLKHLPDKSDLECEYCSDPCLFLCQVYAPYEEDANAFHRTIYIFICKNAGCCKPNQSGNLKVFRSQLGRDNIFYPIGAPVDQENWGKDIDISLWTKTCRVCGILAHSRCAKCKVTNYCCRGHQTYDWKNGHKYTCGIKENNDNSFLFPQYEITITFDDSDEEDMEQGDLKTEQIEIEKYNEMVRNDKAGTLQHENVNDDLLQMASNEKDETFTEFRMKIDNYPDQILRYDRGGKILYISSHNQVTNIPKCPECDGDRQFEFQIMPQLLNFLNFKDIVNCLDWGILAVFTCKKSCIPKDKYVKEYIWKQDIVQEETESKINQDR